MYCQCTGCSDGYGDHKWVTKENGRPCWNPPAAGQAAQVRGSKLERSLARCHYCAPHLEIQLDRGEGSNSSVHQGMRRRHRSPACATAARGPRASARAFARASDSDSAWASARAFASAAATRANEPSPALAGELSPELAPAIDPGLTLEHSPAQQQS